MIELTYPPLAGLAIGTRRRSHRETGDRHSGVAYVVRSSLLATNRIPWGASSALKAGTVTIMLFGHVEAAAKIPSASLAAAAEGALDA